MRIKYIPSNGTMNTSIKYIDENAISIDGEEYRFDSESIAWPHIVIDTNDKILEAHRENGELYLTVLRQYSQSWQEWYSENYQEFKA